MAKGQLPGTLVGKNELCNIMGVSYASLDIWLRNGCPHKTVKADVEGGGSRIARFEFDTAEVRRWREDQAVEEALKKVGINVNAEKSLDDIRMRKMRAEADMAEIALALKSGEAITLSSVVEQWGRLAAGCRAKLLGVPSKVAPLVAAEGDFKNCRALIEAAIEEALLELARYDPKAKAVQDIPPWEESA